MAKIKKRKLRWSASESLQVVGYKLYWEEGEEVNYDSPCAILGKVTEVVLPDDVEAFTPKSGPIEFGITALDELGNESDLITISAPYQFNVPQAPREIWFEDQYKSPSGESQAEESESDSPAFFDHNLDDEEEAIIKSSS